jgi:ribonuclease P protein component
VEKCGGAKLRLSCGKVNVQLLRAQSKSRTAGRISTPCTVGSSVYLQVVFSLPEQRYRWASQHIGHEINGACASTGLKHAWKPSGVVPYSAAAGRRGARVSQSDFPRSTQEPDNFRFPRSRRLTHWSDIRRVGREGRRIRSSNLDLRYTASPLARGRVAIVVPRHGQPVVERNRLRRLLREHLRITILGSLPSVDVVLRALPSAYATEASVLRSELTEMTTRAFERTL